MSFLGFLLVLVILAGLVVLATAPRRSGASDLQVRECETLILCSVSPVTIDPSRNGEFRPLAAPPALPNLNLALAGGFKYDLFANNSVTYHVPGQRIDGVNSWVEDTLKDRKYLVSFVDGRLAVYHEMVRIQDVRGDGSLDAAGTTHDARQTIRAEFSTVDFIGAAQGTALSTSSVRVERTDGAHDQMGNVFSETTISQSTRNLQFSVPYGLFERDDTVYAHETVNNGVGRYTYTATAGAEIANHLYVIDTVVLHIGFPDEQVVRTYTEVPFAPGV